MVCLAVHYLSDGIVVITTLVHSRPPPGENVEDMRRPTGSLSQSGWTLSPLKSAPTAILLQHVASGRAIPSKRVAPAAASHQGGLGARSGLFCPLIGSQPQTPSSLPWDAPCVALFLAVHFMTQS